jgi:antitoxin YefM
VSARRRSEQTAWPSLVSSRRAWRDQCAERPPVVTFGMLLLLGGPLLTWHNFLVILLTMTMLPLGEVKSHLSELVKRVHEHHERVTLMVHGRPSAVLLAIEDLERLEETLAILRDSETVSRLATSDAELARGESVSAEELAAAMRRRPSSS